MSSTFDAVQQSCREDSSQQSSQWRHHTCARRRRHCSSPRTCSAPKTSNHLTAFNSGPEITYKRFCRCYNLSSSRSCLSLNRCFVVASWRRHVLLLRSSPARSLRSTRSVDRCLLFRLSTVPNTCFVRHDIRSGDVAGDCCEACDAQRLRHRSGSRLVARDSSRTCRESRSTCCAFHHLHQSLSSLERLIKFCSAQS